MARKKKSPFVPLLTAGVVLSGALGGLLYFIKGSDTETFSMSDLDEKLSVLKDPRQKEIARVSIAVRAFYAQNQKYPATLEELVPRFLKQVPSDPATRQPFVYEVNGTKFTVGANVKVAAKTEGGTLSDGAPKAPLPAVGQNKELLLLTSLNTPEVDTFVYDATGKRDPFLPFDFSPQDDLDDPSKTPLEKFTLGQLKLTAVLGGQIGDPTAIVETSTGKGFTVRKNTKIGRDNGVVVEIQPDRVLILETAIDFTGEKRNRTVELKLRTAGQEADPIASGRTPPPGKRR
jgi:Tfp pilus assembly protein PilP